MPARLAARDIGVAPFDIGAHPPLSLGFYWSPLKMFEYMAAGLPVVAPAVDRIPRWSRTDEKGCCIRPADRDALAVRARRLSDPALRAQARCRRARAAVSRLQLGRALPRARARHRIGSRGGSGRR